MRSGTQTLSATITGESHTGSPLMRVHPFSRRTLSAGISNTRPVIISTHTGSCNSPGNEIFARSKPSVADGTESANHTNLTVRPRRAKRATVRLLFFVSRGSKRLSVSNGQSVSIFTPLVSPSRYPNTFCIA